MLIKRQIILLSTVLFLKELNLQKARRLSKGEQVSVMLMMKCETRHQSWGSKINSEYYSLEKRKIK